MATDQPILLAEGLAKSFGPKRVLAGVSLAVARAEVLAIIGPNGSGKSTLLRCLNLLESYQRGRVWLDGELVSEGRPESSIPSRPERARAQRLRRRVGMVFQRFNLFPHLTVLDNVMCGPRHVLRLPDDQARAVAEQALRTVGLWEKHPCDPRTLSGGQQQRAAIARALAMGPDVLLLDEPTSSLDPLMTREVSNVIRQLAGGQNGEAMTMLLVTHDLDLARDIAGRMLFMDAGRIIAEGTPQYILDDCPDPAVRRFVTTGY